MYQYRAPTWAIAVDKLVNFLTEDFLGGKKRIPLAWAIDFHKLFTLFLILGMMFYFDNFSTAAWVYLGLHGTYGYCWMIKDLGFRDGSFQAPVTILGVFYSTPCWSAGTGSSRTGSFHRGLTLQAPSFLSQLRCTLSVSP